MPYQFYVREESGEKLYKLIIIKLSRQGMIDSVTSILQI